MARHPGKPVPAVTPDGGGATRRNALARFYLLTSLCQTIIMTVVPLQAYHLLSTAQEVSILYLAIGVTGLFGRLGIPLLVRLISRRAVFMLGGGTMILSAALFASATVPGLVLGLVLNVFAYACLEVVTNLYVLDHIPRGELARFEVRRIFLGAAPSALGPWFGVYLGLRLAPWAPFAVAAAAAALLLAYFRVLGLSEQAFRPIEGRSASPLRSLPRFFRQPRLLLAWILATGRSAWWNLFQVYAPILAVASGLGDEIGGIMVSLGMASMGTVPLWGMVGRRIGFRRLLLAGYVATGLLTLAAALLLDGSWLAAAILVLAAYAAAMIDGAGNSLFLRAVHAHERSEMTAVFISYRDAAQLGPPALYTLLLAAFQLPAVFVFGGIMMVVLARLTRHIPRSF